MEIKPCPFCDCPNPPVSGWKEVLGGPYKVLCPDVDCGASGPRAETAEEAVMLWNARLENEGTDHGK